MSFLTNAELMTDLPRDPGPEFYRRQASHNWTLISDGCLTVLAVVLCIANVVRFWSHLSFFSCIWLGLIAAWIIKFWAQTLRYHRILQDFYERGSFSEVRSDSALYAAVSIAASVTHSALFTMAFIADVLLILFAAAMRGRL
jgi:hypothetical protein